MTVIVGIVQDGRVWIGGDTQATAGWEASRPIEPKVWTDGDWAIGYTGAPRIAQLVRWDLDRPARKDEQPLDAWLATDLTKAYRKVLRDGGALKTNDGVETADGTSLMLGHQGRLFIVHSDFQVAEPSDGHIAIGSGAEYALGALHTTRRVRDPRKRLRTALEAACKFNIGCGAPFTIVEVGE